MATPLVCECCGTGEDEIAIDEATALCLWCQPCPWCGRMGTACQDQHGPAGCDTAEYPDRPRRPFNDAMADLAEARISARHPRRTR